MSEMTIEVEQRSVGGTNVNRRLRKSGSIPAVVYGGGKETIPITVDRRGFLDLLKKSGTEHPVFLLKLAGKERHAMVRELQIEPLSREVVHVDFQRVLMNEKIRVQVPIELKGLAYGVKNESGLLDFVVREVEIDSLPGDIPRQIEIDVTPLHVGDHVLAKDLQLPEGVTLHGDLDRVIVSLTHPRAEEAAGEGQAEPEVIKRGKGEE
jgi:large subunit ribosomal protein L25